MNIRIEYKLSGEESDVSHVFFDKSSIDIIGAANHFFKSMGAKESSCNRLVSTGILDRVYEMKIKLQVNSD